jgi:hypothetical protein
MRQFVVWHFVHTPLNVPVHEQAVAVMHCVADRQHAPYSRVAKDSHSGGDPVVVAVLASTAQDIAYVFEGIVVAIRAVDPTRDAVARPALQPPRLLR